MRKLTLLCVSVVMLSGCELVPQFIRVEPKVDVVPSRIGNSRELLVNVVDERSRKILGTVTAERGGAAIAVEGNLATSVHNAISEGLAKLSFKPQISQTDDKTELRVEIRNLDYDIIVGSIFTWEIRVDAGLKAICVRDWLRPYEKLYHGLSVGSTVMKVKSQETNTHYVNQAVSSAVGSLLSDQALLNCLARPTT